MGASRFAPSTTGDAHLGTAFAALWMWLDAREHGFVRVLRFEDLDRDRSHPRHIDGIVEDLADLGLVFDQTQRQSFNTGAYEQALDELARQGRLYACPLSRREIAAMELTAPDGASAYPNAYRDNICRPGSWRSEELPLRARLDATTIVVDDDSGIRVEASPSDFGDPVVRRRDGSFGFALASVIDDANAGITRVVRGRDLLWSTIIQHSLRNALGLATPATYHHPLLLDESGKKLSKLHRSLSVKSIRRHRSAGEVLGVLASMMSGNPPAEPVSAQSIDFDRSTLRHDDLMVRATDSQLSWWRRSDSG